MIEKIAYNLERNDEEPNIALAIELCETKDRPSQVGQHAERAFVCINKENSEEFIAVLLKRREYLSDSQKKRVDKLIRKIG